MKFSADWKTSRRDAFSVSERSGAVSLSQITLWVSTCSRDVYVYGFRYIRQKQCQIDRNYVTNVFALASTFAINILLRHNSERTLTRTSVYVFVQHSQCFLFIRQYWFTYSTGLVLVRYTVPSETTETHTIFYCNKNL